MLMLMRAVLQVRATWSVGLLGRLLILGLALGLLAGAEIWRSYKRATHNAERFVQSFTKVLAGQTEGVFQAIDVALIGIRDGLQAAPGIAPNDPTYRAVLRERLMGLPYVRKLYVIGPDGVLRHCTESDEPLSVSLEDADDFRAHRDTASLGLHIGRPQPSGLDGGLLVSFSRRITNPDGSFGGVVAAAIDPRHFKKFYQGLSMGQSYVIALALAEGTLLARIPQYEATVGKAYIGSVLHRLALEKGSGVVWGVSPVDHVARLISYRTLAGGNTIVFAGWSSALLLSSWREHALAVGLGAALVWGLVAVLASVSHQHRRRTKLELVRLAQSRRLEMMGRIVGGIAHDLGNTIKIARTTFTLLKPSLPAQSDAIALVEDADRSLKCAFEIIDRLLAFARRQELSPRPTDLAALIEGFSSILRQAVGPRIELVLDLAKPLVCSIDPIHLESALLNLVLNSKDAIPDTGRIVIELREAPASHQHGGRRAHRRSLRPWAEITVRDNGVGMPRRVRDRAFEPFFTTRSNGSGLGLSQVLGFVKQSGGDVKIESSEGRGTAVHLFFPTADETAEGAEASGNRQ